MPAPKMRSLRSIRTVRSLAGARTALSRAGALRELSALATEKELLARELDRCHQRRREIEVRLAEIADKEKRLEEVAAPAGPPVAPRPGAAAGELKVTSFEY